MIKNCYVQTPSESLVNIMTIYKHCEVYSTSGAKYDIHAMQALKRGAITLYINQLQSAQVAQLGLASE